MLKHIPKPFIRFVRLSVIPVIAVAMALVQSAIAATDDKPRPIGYGQHTASDCEERANCVCVVSDLTDDPANPIAGSLRDCLSRKGPLQVIFAARGTIRLKKVIALPSNVAIEGGAQDAEGKVAITITGAGPLFRALNAENVTIRNLRFEADQSSVPAKCITPRRPADTKGCGVPILLNGSRRIWIDHNSFTHCGQICIVMWTAGDPATPVGTDQVSISNNRFENSYYGVAIGAANDIAPDRLPSHMRVTLYRNLFLNVFRRSPKASSGAKVHVFNNVIEYWGREARCNGADWGFAVSATGEAEMLLENNVFIARPEDASCKNAVEIEEKRPQQGYVRGMGKLKATGNLLLNGARLREAEPESVFNPTAAGAGNIAYSYELAPAELLLEQVRANAGISNRVLSK